jgi:hypothetical protein
MAISPRLDKPDLATAIPALAIRVRQQRSPVTRRDRITANRHQAVLAPIRERQRLEIDLQEPTWEDAEWR